VGALATGNGRLVSTFHVALTWQRNNRASIAESAMAGGSKNWFSRNPLFKPVFFWSSIV
jgi:hypothetical protein